MLWFCLTSLCDWSRKLAPSSQPIRCKIKNNRSLLTRVPRALASLIVFTLSSHWLLKCFPFFWLAVVITLVLVLWHTTEKLSVYCDWSRKLKSLSHPIGCKLKLFVIWSPQFSRASSNLWWLIIVVSLWLFRSIIFHFHVCWWYCCLFYC